MAAAEQFLSLVPTAEMVKFCKDGSDATSGAVRLARAYTTHGGETHALAAAIATMKVYQSESVIEHLYRQGTLLKTQGDEVIRRHGLAEHVRLVGKPCCLLYETLDACKLPSRAFRSLFLQETIRRGVLMPSLVVVHSHTNEDIDRTIDAIDGALAV